MTNKEIGSYLHQLINHSVMIRNYVEHFSQATNNSAVKYLCTKLDSCIVTLLNKICVVLGRKDLQQFVDRKIINSQRMLDLMRINELVSRLNEESIAIVADSLEEQLKPVLDAEFNANQTTIEYETNGK